MPSLSGVELLLLALNDVKLDTVPTSFDWRRKKKTEGKRKIKKMISMKSNITAVALVLLLASIARVSEGQASFDVLKYGAKADGTTDISQVHEKEAFNELD